MSEVATRTPSQELVAQVRGEVFKEQIQMMLPEDVPASRFQRSVGTSLLQNPELASADTDSFFSSLFKAAADGLLPDGREAALVIFKGKDGVKRVQYLSMIGGLRKIAAQYGWTIRTNVVYAADEFDYQLGLEPSVTHKPAPVTAERGDPVAAYAVAAHRDGRREVEVMTLAEIEKVRGVSRSKDLGPWKDWWPQMAEKTVGRAIFPKLALDPADKRVARIALDAEDLGPERSAEMLYGPSGQSFQAREIEGSPQGAAEDGTREAAVARQAEADEPEAFSPEPPAPPSVPGFQVPDPVLDAAAEHVVVHTDPQSGWNGRKVGAIADAAAPGSTEWRWLVWACGPDGDQFLDEPTVSAVRLLVQHRYPDVWAEVIS